MGSPQTSTCDVCQKQFGKNQKNAHSVGGEVVQCDEQECQRIACEGCAQRDVHGEWFCNECA